MGTTPLWAYPYPEPSAPVARGAADIKALATKLDAPPGFCRMTLNTPIAIAPNTWTPVGFTANEGENGYVTQSAGKTAFSLLEWPGTYLVEITGVYETNGSQAPTNQRIIVGWNTVNNGPSMGRYVGHMGSANVSPISFTDQMRCTGAGMDIIPMFFHAAPANLNLRAYAACTYLGP